MSGAEAVLLDLLSRHTSFEAMVAAPRGRFLEAARRRGLRTRRLRAPTELRREEHRAWPLTFGVRYGASLVETTSLLVSERPDIVHANNFTAGIYAALPARLRRLPVVWQIHDVLSAGTLEAKVLLRLAPAVRCIVAVSRAVREALVEIGVDPEKITVIPNGIDARERFDPARYAPGTIRSTLGIPGDAIVISMIGQIARHKGSGLVLDAFERLIETTERDVYLAIAGTAPPQARPYERALRERVASSPILSDRVAWLGYRSDVPEVLGDTDVVVNASLVPEAFGMTVLEGMAMAKIVVAPDAAGTAEIVEHGSVGFLFRPGDVQHLASTLSEAVNGLNRLDHVRQRARRKVLDDYDIEVKRDAMNALYERTVSARN